MRGHIEQILMNIATTYQLDPQPLIAYSYEDAVGGWDHNEGRWPTGSIWSVEGRVIYSLVRYLKPEAVVEIGTFYGCSAEHLAAALRENGKGRLYCVDNAEGGVGSNHMIAAWAMEYIDFIRADGVEWLQTSPIIPHVGFVFEDGNHSSELCEGVWRAAAARMRGGMIVSHDAMHFLVGDAVRKGIVESGVPNPRFYLIEPADCGLGMAVLPTLETPEAPSLDEDEIIEEPPKPKPKPKRRRGRPAKQATTRELETEAP